MRNKFDTSEFLAIGAALTIAAFIVGYGTIMLALKLCSSCA